MSKLLAAIVLLNVFALGIAVGTWRAAEMIRVADEASPPNPDMRKGEAR